MQEPLFIQAWPLQSSMFVSHRSPWNPLLHLHLKEINQNISRTLRLVTSMLELRNRQNKRNTEKNWFDWSLVCKCSKLKKIDLSDFLPKSSMVQNFTSTIKTRIDEAGVYFVLTLVSVESCRTFTGVVLEVDALTGSSILAGLSLTGITFSHHLRIRGP